MNAGFSQEWQQEALRHLVRFEAAVVALHRAGEQATAEQRFAVANGALAASMLMNPAFTWRSRPQALAHIADAVRKICARKAPSPSDVAVMMSALEASWRFDPDVRLDALPPEAREEFEQRLQDLHGRE